VCVKGPVSQSEKDREDGAGKHDIQGVPTFPAGGSIGGETSAKAGGGKVKKRGKRPDGIVRTGKSE